MLPFTIGVDFGVFFRGGSVVTRERCPLESPLPVVSVVRDTLKMGETRRVVALGN